MKLRVLVQPRSAKNQVVGILGDRLKVRLNAPPVDGAANAALIAFIASELGLPRWQIQLQAGQTSKQKTLYIPDGTAAPASWAPALF